MAAAATPLAATVSGRREETIGTLERSVNDCVALSTIYKEIQLIVVCHCIMMNYSWIVNYKVSTYSTYSTYPIRNKINNE